MFQLNLWLREVVFFLPLDDLDDVYSMYSLMEDRVTSLNDLCTAFKKRLVEQKFIYKI